RHSFPQARRSHLPGCRRRWCRLCGHFVAILCAMREKSIRPVVAVSVLTTVVLAMTAAAVAQQAGTHPLSGRRYALTMSVEGANWLDRSERDSEEDPDRAIDVLKIAKGSTAADIGAGSGYMTVKLARKVGPEGKVFANDIQP